MITLTYEKLFSFRNLYKAHINGRSGKRSKKPVVRFEIGTLTRIYKLYEELQNGSYRLSKYQSFLVYEPKMRQIQTLPYGDRVVQHCLCDFALAPYFSKRAILDNCVCQKKKGTLFAVQRLVKGLKEYISAHGTNGYFLKCDVLKYFPSIPHDQLKQTFCSQILDTKLRNYVAYIIDSFHTPSAYLKKYNIESRGVGEKTERGLPIGNQSSQIFGMFFLNPLDRYIKETLGIHVYSRYMDDFILVHDNFEELKEILEKIRAKAEQLGLTLNSKTQIFPLTNGITYLGNRIAIAESGKIIVAVKKPTKRRFRSRAKLLKKAYIEGYIGGERVASSLSAAHGCLCHGQNLQFEGELNRKLIPIISECGIILKRKKRSKKK